MMIKVFTKNENGKVELTIDELKKILDEAYWEGYKSNTSLWTYNSPNVNKAPYVLTCTGDSQATIKFNTGAVVEQATNAIARLRDSVGVCTSH